MSAADKPDLPALRRSIQTWARCDPAAMADQSKAAIYFAFQDLLSDVQTLAQALADERRKALEFGRDVAMEYATIHVIGANIAHRLQFEIDRKEPTK